MRILNSDELKIEKNKIIESIVDGAVFIYPTDTIYGIGCNAQISKSVKKVRRLKGRAANPFSVIAPSVDWIKENCLIAEEAEERIDKLPGPYTLILKLKNPKCVAKEINPGLQTLGVRIPSHWISKLVAEAGVPVVTTSVNRSNEDYMTSIEDLDSAVKKGVDFALYEGAKEGRPSRIVDLTEKAKVIER